MANLKSLLPALILIAVPAAAHADEAPAQTGANTNGNNIEMSLRMRKAPIELRETELGARIGVGTVAGQDVGTVSANARRIYYINGSINGSDGDSSGVMIDPGIAVRIDGNRDGKITRQEIEASGFAVYRVRNVGNIHRELNAAEKADMKPVEHLDKELQALWDRAISAQNPQAQMALWNEHSAKKAEREKALEAFARKHPTYDAEAGKMRTPYAAGEATVFRATFERRVNDNQQFEQNAAILQLGTLSGHVGTTLNGVPVDFCGDLQPAGLSVGENRFLTTKRTTSYRLKASGCIGSDLGKVGHVKVEGGYLLLVSPGSSQMANQDDPSVSGDTKKFGLHHAITGTVSLDGIGGSPVGVYGQVERQHTTDGQSAVDSTGVYGGMTVAW